MKIYCMKCKEKTDSNNTKIKKSSNGRLMIIGICTNCGTKVRQFTA